MQVAAALPVTTGSGRTAGMAPRSLFDSPRVIEPSERALCLLASSVPLSGALSSSLPYVRVVEGLFETSAETPAVAPQPRRQTRTSHSRSSRAISSATTIATVRAMPPALSQKPSSLLAEPPLPSTHGAPSERASSQLNGFARTVHGCVVGR